MKDQFVIIKFAFALRTSHFHADQTAEKKEGKRGLQIDNLRNMNACSMDNL